jgi:hypothetical protein
MVAGNAGGGSLAQGTPGVAPAGTYYAPPTGDDQAMQTYTNAQDAYNKALIKYNAQRTGLLRQYGYNGTVDPTTGMVNNIGVDTGNQYGQLQQLLHNQAAEDQQARYAAEDRGLVGGLAHQAQSELHYQHMGQSSDLANSLLGNLNDIDQQQLGSQQDLNNTLWQANQQATQDSINQQLFNLPGELSDMTDQLGNEFSTGLGSLGDSLNQGFNSLGSSLNDALTNIGGMMFNTYPDGTIDYTGGAENPIIAAAQNPRAGSVAANINSASMQALQAARKAGATPAAAALAARSAGLNAKYGLGSSAKKPAPVKNAYTSGQKKRG